MNEMPEISLKTVCCICLSVDRNLTKLCRVDNGVNNLFFLLSYNDDAYEAIFNKGAANFSICWECEALMVRLCKFRDQACLAQQHLAGLVAGWSCFKLPNSLSKLQYYQNKINYKFVENGFVPDNFVDCGPDISFIKSESDLDDTPLANLFMEEIEPIQPLTNEEIKKSFGRRKEKIYISDKKTKNNKEVEYTTFEMTEEEMLESRGTQKLEDSYLNSSSKCESCILVFKDSNDLEKHHSELHIEKPKHIKCDVCLMYIKQKNIAEHKRAHYMRYVCVCEYVAYSVERMETHLKDIHVKSEIKKVKRKGLDTSKEIKVKTDKQAMGYLCKECNKYFDTQNKKYKHIQKCHREGFKCSTCGKSFAFRNTLTRHELVHAGPLPRKPCPTCGKLIRQDLVKAHAHTHTHRQSYVCVSCDKRFVSRASYENHLKNARPHAVTDVLKYKCSECSKGYRSRGELRDHVNYQHIRRTMHKCPICNKALATRRCITRHVRRAHHGIKENARDKICQTCGRAFRDKKCLREHEWIHSGERPWSCTSCGRAFRQRASLYAHRRRLHAQASRSDARAPLLHRDDVTDHALKYSVTSREPPASVVVDDVTSVS